MLAEKQKLEYTVCESSLPPVPVIVVAAGSSRRMGGVNKQTLELCGVPVIIRTLKALENCPLISKIILVVRPDDLFLMQTLCSEYKIKKISDITEGGENRHKSVLCGIARLDSADNKVLIHDGARPFLNDNMIHDCIKALEEYDGCLCAVKVNDTVKQASGELCVNKTVDRSSLYLAQTPQGVNVKRYLEASRNGCDFTDDASVLETAGCRVKIINGDKCNIKITTPEDVRIAEVFINGGLV